MPRHSLYMGEGVVKFKYVFAYILKYIQCKDNWSIFQSSYFTWMTMEGSPQIIFQKHLHHLPKQHYTDQIHVDKILENDIPIAHNDCLLNHWNVTLSSPPQSQTVVKLCAAICPWAVVIVVIIIRVIGAVIMSLPWGCSQQW